MEYYLAVKTIKFAICNNMDGPLGHHAKWNNSERERQIPYYLTYMWNLNKTKAKFKENSL